MRRKLSTASLIAAASLVSEAPQADALRWKSQSVPSGSIVRSSDLSTKDQGNGCVANGSGHDTWQHPMMSTQQRADNDNSVSYTLAISRGGAGAASDDSGDDTENTKKSSKAKKKKTKKSSSRPEGNEADRSPTPKRSSASKSQPSKKSSTSNSSSKTSSTTPSSAAVQNDVPPIVDEILAEEDFYKVLGLNSQEIKQSPDRAAATIKKAYRRRALLTHPDKTNGDRRAFDKVAEAYDVLSDDSKRQMYDRFGKKGVEQGGIGEPGTGGFHPGGFTNAEDLFRSFFGGSMGSGGRGNSFGRNNRTLRYQLEVTLEDLYRGIRRTILVAPPGYGSRTTQNKRVEVQIPRGGLDGQTIVLSGEMDFDSSETPGDLIFELQQRKHPVFTRKGYDLAINMSIRLSEAIRGVHRTIRHVDGKQITIESAKRGIGDEQEPLIIRDGDVHVLKGKGMPKDATGDEFGDLYVQYTVQMPQPKASSTLSKEEMEQLGILLDKLEGRSGNQSDPLKGGSVYQLSKAAASDFGRASGRPQMPQHDESFHESHHSSPFLGARSQFYFNGNPFFGMHGQSGASFGGAADDMDENVQCQQM